MITALHDNGHTTVVLCGDLNVHMSAHISYSEKPRRSPPGDLMNVILRDCGLLPIGGSRPQWRLLPTFYHSVTTRPRFTLNDRLYLGYTRGPGHHHRLSHHRYGPTYRPLCGRLYAVATNGCPRPPYHHCACTAHAGAFPHKPSSMEAVLRASRVNVCTSGRQGQSGRRRLCRFPANRYCAGRPHSLVQGHPLRPNELGLHDTKFLSTPHSCHPPHPQGTSASRVMSGSHSTPRQVSRLLLPHKLSYAA